MISMNDKPRLFVMDWHSRPTIGAVMPNKKYESVVKAIIKNCVGVGYGVPGCWFSDQGGECTGFERNHGIFQATRSNMMKENPEVSRQEALFWCWIAKNALQMVESCTSYQLVFGRNPCLPALAENRSPALVKKPKGQSLAEMLAGQEATGEVFGEVQADEAIPAQTLKLREGG